MLLQEIYTAFAKVFLSGPELSASHAEMCLRHLHILSSAMTSNHPDIRRKVTDLRMLEFWVGPAHA